MKHEELVSIASVFVNIKALAHTQYDRFNKVVRQLVSHNRVIIESTHAARPSSSFGKKLLVAIIFPVAHFSI